MKSVHVALVVTLLLALVLSASCSSSELWEGTPPQTDNDTTNESTPSDTTPNATSQNNTDASGGEPINGLSQPCPEFYGMSYHERSYDPWGTVSAAMVGDYIKNEGAGGEVFVSVQCREAESWYYSIVFHMEKDEIVMVVIRYYPPQLLPHQTVNYHFDFSARAALPGDSTEGNIWASRTSWDPDRAQFKLISSSFCEDELEIEFSTTFRGKARLVNPDGIETDSDSFWDTSTRRTLDVTDPESDTVKLGTYTLFISGTFGEDITSFTLESSYVFDLNLVSAEVLVEEISDPVLSVEFNATFCGEVELTGPDGTLIDWDDFGDGDTCLNLDMVEPGDDTIEPGQYTLVFKADLFDEIEYAFLLDFSGASVSVSNPYLEWEESWWNEGEYDLEYVRFDIGNSGDLPLWIDEVAFSVDNSTETHRDGFYEYVLPGEVLQFSSDFVSLTLPPGTFALNIVLKDENDKVIYEYSTTVTVG